MAAYGALVSVMQIMDQLHRHPHPPISLDKMQSESLAANVTFLQDFLESYNPHRNYSSEADPLESRIAEAAYAAEDVIESFIVDRIHARSSNHVEEISSTQLYQEEDSSDNLTAEDQILHPPTNDGEKMSCIGFFQCVPTLISYMTHRIQKLLEGYHHCVFHQDLQKVIKEMDVIKLEVKKKMKEKKNIGVQIIKKSTADVGLSISSSSTAQKVTTMVGFDDVLYEMLDKIAGGGDDRQIIPIVGMGGLGKTTLARNIYANSLVKEKFHICAWSTISQVHNARKILSEILDQVGLGSGGDLSDGDLGVKLYQHLIGRSYLIVMDDMWSVEAWDVVKRYFPDNKNGSRVVVTTRLSNLASMFNYSNGLDLKFLDEASSWNLFTKTVFGEEICPLELEDIGKKIVEGCRGLPLSIVVVGGLLSKSKPTRENWEVIEGNLSSVVNSEGDGSILQILYVSYNNLPVYIKPCFLYMGVFPEDENILVSKLITLLVGEGFIKPFDGRSLEEAAEDCIKELVDRNLIIVEERNDCGKVKSLKMHDLLRDLALREGEKDKFLCAPMQSSDHWEISHGTVSTQRRIVYSFKEPASYSPNPLLEYLEPASYPSDPLLESLEPALYPPNPLLESLEPASYPPNPLLESLEPASSLVRSLIGEFPKTLSISNIRLLRVCMVRSYPVEEFFIRLANLRVLVVNVKEHSLPRNPSWVSFFWNLQTLYLYNVREGCVLDIWKMPLLRHVFNENSQNIFILPLSFSVSGDDVDEVVLENLHTLNDVMYLCFSENEVRRIPNINTLDVEYGETTTEEAGDLFCLNNLCRLHKLQFLRITALLLPIRQRELITFPYSLKELTLKGTDLPWEDMETKIGCLPLLQVLKLEWDAFRGPKWETAEDQFSSLKFLLIEDCRDLEYWITESSHFPRLEHLILRSLTNLREIPLSIGDIPTLLSIKLEKCSGFAKESAQRIREEQEEYDNELLQIQVD